MEGVGVTLHTDCDILVEGSLRTTVSCQEQWIGTSGEVLTLVEEYKQLVLA